MRPAATIVAVAIAAVLAMAGIYVAGYRYIAPATVFSSGAASPIADPDPADDTAESGPAPAPAAAPARADSLRGTAVDGVVSLDAHGQPRPDRELRRLFDYFLSRAGEQSPEAIRSALLSHVQANLSASAMATVLAWFDAYVALERDSATIARAGEDADSAFARVRSLRRERLGEVLAEAWYGEEERAFELADARRKLLADRGLSADQRERGLRELDAAQSPQQREWQAQNGQLDAAMRQSREFERSGVDAASRYAQREAQYGAQAAQRLAELDQRRAQWQQRLRSYAAQRQRLLADGRLDDAQREQRLNALLAGFDPGEQRRVDALTRNGLLPGQPR